MVVYPTGHKNNNNNHHRLETKQNKKKKKRKSISARKITIRLLQQAQRKYIPGKEKEAEHHQDPITRTPSPGPITPSPTPPPPRDSTPPRRP
jgi:hypothetical protein